MKSIPESDQLQAVKDTYQLENVDERTLSVKWNIRRDIFTFSTNKEESKECIKRNVLKTVSSIFGPLGFVSPFVVLVKVFPQKVWRFKVDWDEVISKRNQEYWKELTKNLSKFTLLKIPRCHHILRYQVSDIQLHVFSDASEVTHDAIA